MHGYRSEIDNNEQIIDSRDVVERITFLRNEIADLELNDNEFTDEIENLKEELTKLKILDEDGRNEFSEEWEYGVGLIHEDYFVEYAEQLAEDIGAIDKSAGWPSNYIDWDAAASALKVDYNPIDFDGETYWAR
jgi:hypothetical protein